MTNFDWTMDVVDYFIRFDEAGDEYLITSFAAGVLNFTVGTQQAVPTSTTSTWEIRGYAKGHTLHLLGYIYPNLWCLVDWTQNLLILKDLHHIFLDI